MKYSQIVPILLVAASGLSAQEGTRWVNLQGGFVTQDHNTIKDSEALGLGFGGWINNRFGAEISGLNTYLKSSPTRLGGYENHGFLSGMLNLNPGGSTWYPYLRAGLGATLLSHDWSGKSEATTRLNLHAGLGLQAALSERFLGSLEARAVRVETQTSRTEYMALLGLGYRWGTASKQVPAVVPAPVPEPIQPPAPAPVPEVPKPAEVVKPLPPPPPTPVPAPPKKIVLNEAVLHFANSKANMSPAGVEAVQKVASGLKAFGGSYTLIVSGHTSSLGGKALNKSIAKRRAEAVAKVLRDAGIPAASIQTEGVGSAQPVADNKTKEGQARNRRVEIDIKTADAKVEVQKIEVPIETSAKK